MDKHNIDVVRHDTKKATVTLSSQFKQIIQSSKRKQRHAENQASNTPKVTSDTVHIMTRSRSTKKATLTLLSQLSSASRSECELHRDETRSEGVAESPDTELSSMLRDSSLSTKKAPLTLSSQLSSASRSDYEQNKDETQPEGDTDHRSEGGIQCSLSPDTKLSELLGKF